MWCGTFFARLFVERARSDFRRLRQALGAFEPREIASDVRLLDEFDELQSDGLKLANQK